MQVQTQHISPQFDFRLFIVFLFITTIAEAAEMPNRVGTISRVQGAGFGATPGFRKQAIESRVTGTCPE